MAKVTAVGLFLACIVVTAQAQALFKDNFLVTYGGNHVQPMPDGQTVKVTLDKTSGANFRSMKSFVYGGFSAQVQLPAGDSAGTCTAFFLSSEGNAHDELDYEFLGNVTGQPYIVQTNVFADGVGGREERIYLWFDPTIGFHTYEIVWNPEQITFLIDGIPVRIFGNYPGIKYPSQPMGVYNCLYDASPWATRGGLVPIDYSKGPFVAYYKNFGLSGCAGACPANQWWELPSYKTLSPKVIDQLRWVRKNFLKYSYCTDTKRNPMAPAECARNNP